MTTLTSLDIRYGAGHHMSDISPSNIAPHFKVVFIGGFLYTLVLPITKLSICFLYQRIVDVERFQKILIQVLAGFLVLTAIGFTCFQITLCIPIPAFWNEPFGPQCRRLQVDESYVMNAIAAWNIFADFCIIAIVLPVIWHLKLQYQSKIALYGVVCIGVLSMIASIIRVTILVGKFDPTDPFWTAADVDLWSCVECNTGLICAAAPCIRPFIYKMRDVLSPVHRRMSITQSNDDQPSLKLNDIENSKTLDSADEMRDYGYNRTQPLPLLPTTITTPANES